MESTVSVCWLNMIQTMEKAQQTNNESVTQIPELLLNDIVSLFGEEILSSWGMAGIDGFSLDGDYEGSLDIEKYTLKIDSSSFKAAAEKIEKLSKKKTYKDMLFGVYMESAGYTGMMAFVNGHGTAAMYNPCHNEYVPAF